MFKKLQIENYRIFKHLQLNDVGSCQLTVHLLPKAKSANDVWGDGFGVIHGLIGSEVAGKIALMHPTKPA
jgi:AAA15 family ATPase/GTPase